MANHKFHVEIYYYKGSAKLEKLESLRKEDENIMHKITFMKGPVHHRIIMRTTNSAIYLGFHKIMLKESNA